jgi:hypothetical protein
VTNQELLDMLAESDALLERSAALIKESQELIVASMKLREKARTHLDRINSSNPDSPEELNPELSVQDD